MQLPIGTFYNIILIIIGGTIGLFFKQSLSEKLNEVIFQVIALFTIVLGIKMVTEAQGEIVILFGTLLGTVIGYKLDLKTKFEGLADRTKSLFKLKDQQFSEALIFAFILFCIGPVTFLGALNEGLEGDRTLIITKGIMDGVTSIFLCSAMGYGVIFSGLPMLIFQGGITVLAIYIAPYLIEFSRDAISGLGGLMMFALALNMLKLKKISLENMLPSIPIVLIMSYLYYQYFV